jgi:hypothetical protein
MRRSTVKLFALLITLCCCLMTHRSVVAVGLTVHLPVRTIDGHATYYYGCDGSAGSGACGYCDEDAHHAAWPHLPQTGCYRYCEYLYSESCGDDVTVSDLCPYKGTLQVEIRDCCTCDSGGCDGNSICSGSGWNSGDVVIDLTPAAFMSLHGSLADGRIPVRVYYDY